VAGSHPWVLPSDWVAGAQERRIDMERGSLTCASAVEVCPSLGESRCGKKRIFYCSLRFGLRCPPAPLRDRSVPSGRCRACFRTWPDARSYPLFLRVPSKSAALGKAESFQAFRACRWCRRVLPRWRTGMVCGLAVLAAVGLRLSRLHPHELGMRVWNSCVVAGARTAFCRAFSVEVEAIVERIQRPCQSSSAGEGAIRETCVKGGSLYDSQLMMEKPQKYLTSGFVQYIIFTTHASRSRRRGDGQSPRHA